MQLQYVSRHSSLPVSDFSGINVIGGFWGNTISNGVLGGTIAGGGYNALLENLRPVNTGYPNVVAGDFGSVGGGYGNIAGAYGAIAGGVENSTTNYSAVTGGESNSASYYSAVAGGEGNWATNYSVVGGGQGNQARNFAAVGGGTGNQASGFFSVVPGGANNFAGGDYSFAAGDGALAQSDHSFVWNGGISNDLGGLNLFFPFDNGPNTVTFYAQNGIYMITGISQGNMVGASLGPGDSSWSSLCDRNAKKNFQPVDAAAILEKLVRIPIQQWNYKSQADSDTPNIGPMAQDFKGAFYPGRDDKHISTLEFDGVELAAIQGLYQKLESGNQKLESENAELRAKNTSLEKRLEALERAILNPH
jgi:hypothetical protein